MAPAPRASEQRGAGARQAPAGARPTSRGARAYAVVATLAVFLVLWATIALHPWQASAPAGSSGSSLRTALTSSSATSGGASQPVTATRTS